MANSTFSDGALKEEGVEQAAAAPDGGGGSASSSFLGLLFSRGVGIVAWVGIGIALLMPSNGVGVSLCGMYRIYQIPCPGCGMTRSVSHFFHLNFLESFIFNPFGIVFSILMMIAAMQIALPRKRIDLLMLWLKTSPNHADLLLCSGHISIPSFWFSTHWIDIVFP